MKAQPHGRSPLMRCAFTSVAKAAGGKYDFLQRKPCIRCFAKQLNLKKHLILYAPRSNIRCKHLKLYA